MAAPGGEQSSPREEAGFFTLPHARAGDDSAADGGGDSGGGGGDARVSAGADPGGGLLVPAVVTGPTLLYARGLEGSGAAGMGDGWCRTRIAT